MDKVQQHIEQLRELAYLLPRRAVFLRQSADTLEQQQREIVRMRESIELAMEEEWRLAGEQTDLWLTLHYALNKEVSRDVQETPDTDSR